MISNLKKTISNNKLIIENYFFMTFLQFLNSFLYLLIYPFLILKLGAENYGIYVFSLTLITFLICLVNFGFEIPALKRVTESSDDNKLISNVFSNVFFGKLYLLLFSFVVFYFATFLPIISDNKEIFYILLFQLVGAVFLPLWYFQAKQKMKILTVIQVTIKILTLPLIYLYVKDDGDLWVFTLIASLGVVISAVLSFLYVLIFDKVNLEFKNILVVKEDYIQSTPYFLSIVVGVMKEQIIVISLGVFFGMKEVALYDLAMKIIAIPRTIFVSLNTAIFPKVIKNLSNSLVSRVIKIEFLIGIIVVVLIAIFGKYIVEFLGAGNMDQAYGLSIILSGTVTVWLVVGCYIYFTFVPSGRSDLVYKNQIVALFSLVVFLILGLGLFKSITVFAWAILLSGICEIIYCYYVSKRLRLL